MKRILVGLDGSHRAPSVLSAAILLARQENAKLVLMRAVMVPSDLPPEACGMPFQSITRLLEERARYDLASLARDVPAEMNGGVRTIVGTPWQAICKAAKEEGADLIFIGTHSRDGLDQVIGSTATRVLENADRSVFVYRDAPIAPRPLEEPARKLGYELF